MPQPELRTALDAMFPEVYIPGKAVNTFNSFRIMLKPTCLILPIWIPELGTRDSCLLSFPAKIAQADDQTTSACVYIGLYKTARVKTLYTFPQVSLTPKSELWHLLTSRDEKDAKSKKRSWLFDRIHIPHSQTRLSRPQWPLICLYHGVPVFSRLTHVDFV